MNIFVNAASIKEGGSLAVVENLLPAMSALRPTWRWHVAVNSRVGEQPSTDQINWIRVDTNRSPLSLLTYYEMRMLSLVRERHCNILFSLTNYLPLRAIGVPAVLLVQHAGHFSLEYENLRRAAERSWSSGLLWRLKTRWVENSIKKASRLTVQTAALARAVVKRVATNSADAAVIPHGPGWIAHRGSVRSPSSRPPWRIGFVSKWSFHKDFPTLLRAFSTLRREGLEANLILTLDPQVPAAQEFLRHADAIGVGSAIENWGDVEGRRMHDLYDSLDIFAFPSRCESFGMPMVEAMARGVPMVVSDTLENLEITAGAAAVFRAGDADALSLTLKTLLSDNNLRREQSAKSLRRGKDFSWTEAARQTIDLLASVQPSADA